MLLLTHSTTEETKKSLSGDGPYPKSFRVFSIDGPNVSFNPYMKY